MALQAAMTSARWTDCTRPGSAADKSKWGREGKCTPYEALGKASDPRTRTIGINTNNIKANHRSWRLQIQSSEQDRRDVPGNQAPGDSASAPETVITWAQVVQGSQELIKGKTEGMRTARNGRAVPPEVRDVSLILTTENAHVRTSVDSRSP